MASAAMVKPLPGGGVKVGPWSITAKKGHILKSDDIEALSKELSLPLPEMVFGENVLRIENDNGFKLIFEAKSALALVNNRTDTLKVSYAEVWSKSRGEETMQNVKDVVKPYDWTFTTRYAGNFTHLSGHQPEETMEQINMDILKRPDPIIFYEELVLFEDELADNGTSKLTARIRVMPGCLFVLLRFFLRVDDVIVRIIDSRYFHEFGKAYLIHEQSTREATFDKIAKDLVKGPLDKAQTGNENWLYSILPVVETTLHKIHVATSG